MSESKLPRLLAAAKEFNIGQDTLVDFLSNKGFSKDDLKPTSKLTDAMYRALQQEFQSDKAAKIKSNQVDLPKGTGPEVKRKRDEVDMGFKPVEVAPIDKPIVLEPTTLPVFEQPIEEAISKEVELTKMETPELEMPKVVDKIDLSAIDSSTRPKQTKKTSQAEVLEQPQQAEQPEPTKAIEVKVVVAAPVVPAGPKEDIMKLRADKIEGPKILGKIDLPVTPDKNTSQQDERRKRKRIPMERKDNRTGPDNRNRPNPQQPPQRPQQNNWQPQQNRPGFPRRDDNKVIDEKAIQEKIRQTQAKLSGGGHKGKNIKAKIRREKRQEMAEENEGRTIDRKINLTEFISVSELASLMDVGFTEVISKCMGLGIMVSINQRLDAEVIELVAAEFGFDVEFIDMEKQMEIEHKIEADVEEDLQPRSPIVTIMGHVDHGKTSLLDYIRSANVVAGEAGGITQHIGAYKVHIGNGKDITFLDTPGHEAFTAMRARGAKVTDIAVIVVAADDAVMPQTKEAISHAQAAGVPMIFAVNKIDKDGANPTKIYEQLSQMNILVEDWGGKFQSQEIAAKSGLNVDKLLEKILLEAEILELKANPNREAVGTIIEASLDRGRGYVATVLVENGTLHSGDLMVSGQHFGRVKAMFNERNKKEDAAGPAAPAVILGLNGAPQAGEKFKVYADESEAKAVANKRAQILREQGIRTKKHITLDEIGRRLALGNFKELNIIIKGDVDGSVEALSDSLQKLSTAEIAVKVLLKGVGQISEGDVTLANASDAIIIGFNVRPSLQAGRMAENEGVEIKLYSIIYTAIDEIRSAMEGMLEPKFTEKIVANVEIREVFKFDKATVAGCYVLDGKIKRDSKIRVIRDGIVEHPKGENQVAELSSLKRFKDDVKDVISGMECGLTIKNYTDIKVGDIVEAYEQEEVKRTL